MKRRWFLTGLALTTLGAGCRSARSPSAPSSETAGSSALILATSANYPPYELIATGAGEGTEEGADIANSEMSRAEVSEATTAESTQIVGFDIDLARLIAAQLGRELSIVDMEFDELFPALANRKADMAMAAIEPTRSRRQRADFSEVYYRSRQALVSVEGSLRSRDLDYQIIGIRAESPQSRYANRLVELDYPDLELVTYPTLEEMLEAVATGVIDGVFLESAVAEDSLIQYGNLGAQPMPYANSLGSAIALPKNSPLRSDINGAIAQIQASGELDRLVQKWFV